MIKVQWDLLWCISVSVKVFDLEKTSRPSSWLFYSFFLWTHFLASPHFQFLPNRCLHDYPKYCLIVFISIFRYTKPLKKCRS